MASTGIKVPDSFRLGISFSSSHRTRPHYHKSPMPPKQHKSDKLDVNFLLNDPPSSSSAAHSSSALPPRSAPSPHVTAPSTGSRRATIPAVRTRSDGSKSSSGGSNGSKDSGRKSIGSKSSDGSNKSAEVHRSTSSKRARRVRVPSERTRCTICGHSFTQVGDLTKHIRTVHEKQRPFQCDLCDKAFGEKGNLQKHRRSVHFNVRPFKCNSCEAAFAFRDGLVRHSALVHGERNFVCPRCGARHQTKAQLKRHQESCATAGSSSRPN